MKFSVPLLLGLLGGVPTVSSQCPFSGHRKLGQSLPNRLGTPIAPHALPASYYERRRLEVEGERRNLAPMDSDHPMLTVELDEYYDALKELDLDAVETDLKVLFADSQDWWPADYGVCYQTKNRMMFASFLLVL